MPPSRRPRPSFGPRGDRPSRSSSTSGPRADSRPAPRAASRPASRFGPRPASAARPHPSDAAPDNAPYRTIGGGVRIVHEDDHILVLDKPPGLLTSKTAPNQSSRTNDSVFDLVKEYAKAKSRKRGVRAWIIHRLDKEASGLLVFAKTEDAFRMLKDEFRTKRAHRLYAAVIEGTFAQPDRTSPSAAGTTRVRPAQLPSGTIQSYLYEDERGLVHSTDTPSAVPRSGRGGDDDDADPSLPRLAVTHFQVQQQFSAKDADRALLQVRLETGRKNQIRAHLRSINKPIVGDRRYGAVTDPVDRLCLHATELGFAHPATGQSVRFRSPIPIPFLKLVGLKTEQTAPATAPGDAAAPQPKSPLPAPVLPAPVPPAPTAPIAAPPVPSHPSPLHSPPPVPISPQPVAPAPPARGWDHVAAWYDNLLDERGSDHHEQTILPGTLRLLNPQKGMRLLDIACGQGILCRRLSALGVRCVGVDAAPNLIERAAHNDQQGIYIVGDARELSPQVHDAFLKPFDAVTCIMALMNIEPLSPVLSSAAQLLRPGGAFVAVLLHPAFRALGQSSWGWDLPLDAKPRAKDKGKRKGKRSEREPKAFSGTQYRRIDGYLSSYPREIVMNPGAAAHGKQAIKTVTFHRPVQHYVKALADAGLLLSGFEEWASQRQSQAGPRAVEENRARREIPMFLALRAVKA